MTVKNAVHRTDTAYLQDVLMRLPTTPAGQLDELLPDRWQAAQKAKLAAAMAALHGAVILSSRADC